MNIEVEKSSFWEEKYLTGQTPWDLHQPNPVFLDLLKEGKLLQQCKMLIPGCGKGHDAIAAAKHGYDVTAVDFSGKAISIGSEIGKKENLKIDFQIKDIFQMDGLFENSFDAVYDYTLFCAINPDRRAEYSEKIFQLLKKGGKFAVILFPLGESEDGPPFGINPDEFYKMFSKKFKLCFSSRNINSVEPRKGREMLQIYMK